MIKVGKTKSLIIFFPVLFLLSCDNSTVFSSSRVIEDSGWNKSYQIVFEAEINDTINSFDINFLIRTNSTYPYRNIFLFVNTLSPSGASLTDTLEYNLANEKGEWYGKGLGDINDLSLPFRSKVYFPEKGEYRFTITQGMRENILDGVMDFGIRIQSSN